MPKPTDTAAPSAAPPNAIRMWVLKGEIYCELPASTSARVNARPHILRFPLREAGLSKALQLLCSHPSEWERHHASASRSKPATNVVARLPLSPSDAIAQNILRRRGLIK